VDPGDSFDKYTIERVLGEGGMATVYLARHEVLDSLHALKILRVAAPDIRRRLLAEGKVQASIRHPNVVAVTDILDIPEGVALVMEYVEGTNLERRLVDHGALTPREALELFRGIAQGVAAAHRDGVVHRDLKPANILLQQLDGRTVPKVTDFGLVKILKSSATQSGVLMGTPEYMSPEQVRDSAKVDQRSDLWSLGALLYEMLTGHVAFDKPDIVQVYTAIVDGEYVSLEELRPTLPPRVMAAVRRLLQVEPDARFASAEDLLAYLYPDDPVAREPTVPRATRRPSADTPKPSTDDLRRRRPTPASSEAPVRARSIPPPRPPPPPRRGALIVASMLVAMGAICAGAASVSWWSSRVAAPAMREVVLRPVGPDGPLAADAPLRVRLEGATYQGVGPIAVGPEPIGRRLQAEVVYGVDCGDCPSDCPPWCSISPVDLVVPQGMGAAELTLPIAPPAPVTITVRAPGASLVRIDEGKVDLVDGTGTASLLPGPHQLVVQRGACDGAPPDCTATDTCPEGCDASVARALEIGLTAPPEAVEIALPAPPERPAPIPSPEPQPTKAPPAPPKLVSNQAFASFVGTHPDWGREAAIARGAADQGYLRDWTDGPPPGPVTRLSWKAAAAYCAGRGGLLGIDEPPWTWEAGAVQLEWRASGSGGLAWRRYDGVTSTQARVDQTVPFTGVRCRR